MTRKNTDGWAGLVDVDDGEPAPRPSPPPAAKPELTKGLTLDAPPPSGVGLKLPKPAGAPSGPARAAQPTSTPAATPAPPPQNTFSNRELLDKLDLDKPKTEAKGSLWNEYRELILTAIAGLLILAAVLAYRAMPSDDEVRDAPAIAAEQKPKEAAPAPAPPAPPAPAAAPEPAPTAEQQAPAPIAEQQAAAPIEQPVAEAPAAQQAPQRAAVPMLSVITTPPGASIEVNGLVRGKSPLIIPSPSVEPTLQVRVTMDGFKNYEENVSSGEGGHYVLRVELEPAR